MTTIKYLKSTVTLFSMLNPNGSWLGLVHVLFILAAQGTAKLPEFTVGGLRKLVCARQPRCASIVKCKGRIKTGVWNLPTSGASSPRVEGQEFSEKIIKQFLCNFNKNGGSCPYPPCPPVSNSPNKC